MVSWDLWCYGWVRSDLYTDVDIKIEACGVCGSDVHTISGRENEQTNLVSAHVFQVDGEIRSSHCAWDTVRIQAVQKCRSNH